MLHADSDNDHREKDVSIDNHGRIRARSSQRKVDVVTNPIAERDVPASQNSATLVA